MSEAQSDISLLFSRDPLSLTKEDRAAIITHFRANREKYISGEKQAKLPKAVKVKADVPDIDLGDLEL